MRREELYLRDIVEAAGHIASFVAGLDFEKFEESELVRSAVVQKLAVMGEAAGRLPGDLKARHPGVPWAKVAAFRNILVHAYFGIDWKEVWRAAAKQAPELRDQIASILAAEFPPGD
ncbi:MAG TPA: DUF86 domain-containing protein [Bryobacteraceae bacterium]|nr:DUF86 domain-containing protein [Bryobacteraceae bacterium]